MVATFLIDKSREKSFCWHIKDGFSEHRNEKK